MFYERGIVTITCGDTIRICANGTSLEAKEIVSRLLIGQSEYALSHVYIAYGNVEHAAFHFKNIIAETFYNLQTPYDFIRMPITSLSLIRSQDNGPYDTIEVQASVCATKGEHGVPFGPEHGSRLVALAAVASPRQIAAQDKLYAYTILDPTEGLHAKDSVSVSWRMTISI